MARSGHEHSIVTPDGGRIPINPLQEGTHWLEDPETHCWNWQQFVERGYARHRLGPAHRVVYRQFGGTIPEGWDLHHECENKRCVNPDHMQPREKVPHLRGHWRGRIALTQEQITEIRELGLDPTLRQQDIADRFGVPRTTVSSILTGQSWSDGVRVTPAGRTCPECGAPVEGRRSRKFCCSAHRTNYNAKKARAA